MNVIVTTNVTLDELTANIKLKLVENHVLENAFNRNINQNSVDIGQWLTQAKKLVKHGQWQNWLQENFQMTDRTAQRYMKIARYFGISGVVKTDNVVGFQYLDIQKFIQYFAKFGVVLYTQKKPDDAGDNFQQN